MNMFCLNEVIMVAEKVMHIFSKLLSANGKMSFRGGNGKLQNCPWLLSLMNFKQKFLNVFKGPMTQY